MNVVKNGSFETPVVQSGGFDTIPTDGDALPLTDWTVDSGNDRPAEQHLLECGGWQPVHRPRRRVARAQSRRSIPTIVGQKYDVKFRYTANPESPDPAPTWR